jgi:glycosyltransferase involved in cell wall biosynthesis
MPIDKPRILVISSVSLSVGPAIIASQYYDALREKGFEVDLLLKEPEPGRPEFLHVVRTGYDKTLWNRIKKKLKSRFDILGKQEKGYCFFYKKENHPPVPSSWVVRQIRKPYDLVLVFFWQGMLSFESIEGIYDKLHCQIQFMGVDYSQMSGGCHFTGNCQRYKSGCGCCPAFHSKDENDFTAWNVQFRKRVYEKVNPIVYGNQYMMRFYRESYLLKDVRCEINPCAIIDTKVFKSLDKQCLRRKYDIPGEKKNLIFFACQNLNDERKGMRYLIEALNYLYENLQEKASEVLILMAGRDFEKVRELIPFEAKGLGYVPMDTLPEIYSMSTMFVCPSVNDAGPMMVGQSLCCGTPVVGFEMGSVLQLVKNQRTGISVPLRDSKALAQGMEQIIRMSEKDDSIMSSRCREVALENCSYEAQANLILRTYHKYANSVQ